jgi:hypothetical protein
MDKFKVGDVVRAHNRCEDDGVITFIDGPDIYIKPTYPKICTMFMNGRDSGEYKISYFCLELLLRRIADTKITRRMYKDKIKKEENGYIFVAMQ